MNDLDSDAELADKPSWFKRISAGVVDVLSRYIDRAANNAFIRSIDSRKYMERKCEMLGYELQPHSTSSGTLRFNIDPDNLPVGSIPKTDLIALWTDGGSSLQFEARAGTTFSAVSESVTVDNSTDIITVVNSYDTGDLVRITATAFPGGLSASTNYYAIRISATQIKLATNLNNSLAGTAIDITSDGTSVIVTSYALKVTCYQQKTIDQYLLATPTTDIWQEFILRDIDVLHETVTVIINSITWTRQTDWLLTGATDTHYRVRQLTTGEYLEFGDEESFGKIPDADIYVSYAVGGKSASNINSLNTVNKYLGNNASILDVTNTTTFSGGLDRESIEKARRLSVILIGQNDLFLEDEYSVALILAYGSTTHAHVDHNYYGTLTSRVVIVPAGGGTSSSAFKTELKTYLESRSFGISVTVFDASYIAQNITSTIKLLTGYDYTTVKGYYELALSLILDETGLEVLDIYESTGIADAITEINAKYSTAFSDFDYNEIEAMIIRIIQKQEYATINKTLQVSDVYGIVEDIAGLDYAIISTSFPITMGLNEITSIGTLTTTEIP
jgi:hypothetical protein